MTIHKSAVICDSAQIAPDVEIGPNVVIGEGVIIASGVKIGAGANIEYATIGEGTKISPMASIGGEPQDLGYKRIDRSRAERNKYVVTYDLTGLVYSTQYLAFVKWLTLDMLSWIKILLQETIGTSWREKSNT